MTSANAIVIGGGPVGCLLALVLAKRGWRPVVYEKRPDLRAEALAGGRSINLVLTRRGLRGLERVGLRERALEITVPVLGRMMHDLDGELTYTPYGKDDSECNYSISRDALNAFLLDAVEKASIPIFFEHALERIDYDAGELHFTTPGGPISLSSNAPIFGADGAPSAVRKSLEATEVCDASVEMLPDGYKELLFPAASAGDYSMAGHALHIWPRGRHFLMGLANLDGSFTGTLYLPHEGPESFAAFRSPSDVRAFFRVQYPDAIPLLDDFEHDFFEHPTGVLGTVRTYPWHWTDRVLLVGDAAHGIVPFFGQGLNSGFEDCVVFDQLLEIHGEDRTMLFERMTELRKPQAEAIADMALENYVEMRDRVADARFILRKRVESRMEKTWPERYRSRYAMVMYSFIPYRIAFDLGKVQDALLEALIQDIDHPDQLDMELASRLIDERFTPEVERHKVSLGF